MVGVIVTGTDGSESAGRAVHKAAELAQQLGAGLHIVSAFHNTSAVATVRTDEYASSQAERAAAKARDAIRAGFPRLDVTTSTVQGRPSDALSGAARDLDAELIVVGNRRVQGLSRLLGSVANDVASHASCDVYIAYTRDR